MCSVCHTVLRLTAYMKVVINDELRELVLPTDLQSSIWGQDQRGFHDGGIESVVPFHYPALLSTYTESLLFPSPSKGGLLLRTPALKKLKVSLFLVIVHKEFVFRSEILSLCLISEEILKIGS